MDMRFGTWDEYRADVGVGGRMDLREIGWL
jgi:hypothetical protein